IPQDCAGFWLVYKAHSAAHKLPGSTFSVASGCRLQFDLRGNFLDSVKNSKSRITDTKQITMTKIRNSKLLVFDLI
ncbi:MAG: hypothetical protein PVG81_12725, partial [Desulfobacterales bacterium]